MSLEESLNAHAQKMKAIESAAAKLARPSFDPTAMIRRMEYAASDLKLPDPPAMTATKVLRTAMADFDASLDEAHELGLRLVSFGQAVTLRVDNVYYEDGGLLIFTGTGDDGQPVRLYQHLTQVSVLFTSVQRENPAEPKPLYGFNQAVKQSPDASGE